MTRFKVTMINELGIFQVETIISKKEKMSPRNCFHTIKTEKSDYPAYTSYTWT